MRVGLRNAAADSDSLVEQLFMEAWAATARSPPPGARAKAAARKSAQEALRQLREGEGYAAEVGMQLTETASWLLAKGLVTAPPLREDEEGEAEGGGGAACSGPSGGAPLMWLNGITSRPAGAAAEDLLYKIMAEMQRLQEWVYFQKLTDGSAGGDAAAAILALAPGGLVERINPRLMGAKARNAQPYTSPVHW
ncbi:hypothetical protein GPECTOR_45g156 [Gonium pectorale]|uniref:Uncharacterized protein n=1 Tax=Gonium pectorale TaxID=33097 RepID=A0A150G8V3_GONPE|nr:hypothetical protein GPECTOR_45g156 [Gonium pectorale]|eukprot:KXZ46286.1 hypothetical protein GPECTOR_45g156 [Gonium pectorale]